MTKAVSSEELRLKKRARRRLVGAIALVLVVIVFLPMILDNEPRQMSQDISINIPLPPQDSEEPIASEALRFIPAEPSTPEVRTTPISPSPETEKQMQAAAKPEVREPEKKPQSTSVRDGFVVQLGAFSTAENATKLAAKVRESRFKAYTEVVSTTQGKRTRVRVGPYPTRAAAEDALERLKARKLTFGDPTIVRPGE